MHDNCPFCGNRLVHTEWEITDITSQTCDLCDKKLPLKSVCQLDGSITLCQDCYKYVNRIPENHIKAGIKRILDRNVI